jgi:hypothetical protein
MLLGLRKDSFLMASSRTLYLEEKGDHSFACLSMASIIPSTPIEAHLLDQTANGKGGMNRWMDGGWLRSSSHQP